MLPATEHPGHDWHPAIPIGCTLLAAGIMTIAVMQPRHAGYSTSWGVGAALLVMVPFIFDDITLFTRKPRDGTPLWLFPIPVVIGVSYFLLHPADTDIAPFILVLISGEVVSRSRGRIGAGYFTGALSIAAIVGAEAIGPWRDGAFIWVAGISFGWVGGFLVRELEGKTYELQEAQAGLAEKAAADERSRIAREVHDVIAHSLSVTMLHVTAARMALEKGDRPDVVTDSLREAEQQGRRSLTEIRRTVGLLGDEESATAAPMPLANDLPQLISDFRNAGVHVSLHMNGDVDGLPPAAGLALYRIVQESLTNVAKHAPDASALVELDVTGDEIKLRVHNGPSSRAVAQSDGAGLGLRGMTERAALLGGTLHTRNGGAGWTVEMKAPRPAADVT